MVLTVAQGLVAVAGSFILLRMQDDMPVWAWGGVIQLCNCIVIVNCVYSTPRHSACVTHAFLLPACRGVVLGLEDVASPSPALAHPVSATRHALYYIYI